MAQFVADHQAIVALTLLLLLFVAFVIERYPPDVTAAAGAAIFIVLGLVPLEDVRAAFSNSAPITIAAMFVLSGALVRTGLLDALANRVVSHTRSRPIRSMGGFFVLVVVASAFVNNTPLVLILIPIVIRLADTLGIASTRLLIPLSYAAILGGTLTLIGTSTNLLVDGVAQEAGLEPFALFEIAPVGIVTALAGMGLLALLGPWLLPRRGAKSLSGDEPRFLTEVRAAPDSHWIGTKIGEIKAFSRPGVRLIGVKSGATINRSTPRERPLDPKDIVIVAATGSELLTLRSLTGFEVGMKRLVDVGRVDQAQVVEAIVGPTRAAVGMRLRELTLGRRYGVKLLGIHRHGHTPGPDLGSARLRASDRAMLEGSTEGINALVRTGEFVSISRPSGNAVAVILTPIVIALAAQIGVDPRAFVVAVMFGASASFATPIGYQTNTLVYGAGDYRFADFLRIGIPMNIVAAAAAITAIAWFFPLYA